MARKLTNTEFISRALKVHGDRYDYTKTLYLGTGMPVGVVCPAHGLFYTRASQHLKGVLCQMCASAVAGERRRRGVDSILQQMLASAFGKFYSYNSLPTKLNTTDKVVVTCSLHGEFATRPVEIFRGSGCPKCWEKRRKVSHV